MGFKETSNKIKKLTKGFEYEDAYQLSTLRHAPEMSGLIYDIKKAFDLGIEPEKPENSSSTFFHLKDETQKPIAVFKTNNFLREYAAYRLDHKRFAGVPPTVITTLEHPKWKEKKTGSLQLFIEDATAAVQLRSEAYKKFSPSSVRKIASLDIRCLNGDRHSSNLLVRNETELIPIDHEFILQTRSYITAMTWLRWDQAATPFVEEEMQYISALDPEEDRKILMEELGMDEEIATRYFISNTLLKIATFRGVSPNVLGGFLKRRNSKDEKPAVFEQLLERLKKFHSFSWTFFSQRVYEEIEKILDEKCV